MQFLTRTKTIKWWRHPAAAVTIGCKPGQVWKEAAVAAEAGTAICVGWSHRLLEPDG